MGVMQNKLLKAIVGSTKPIEGNWSTKPNSCISEHNWLNQYVCWVSDVHSEPSQRSEMELLAKIVNGWKLLTISAKSFILDVWLGIEYASEPSHYCLKQKFFFKDLFGQRLKRVSKSSGRILMNLFTRDSTRNPVAECSLFWVLPISSDIKDSSIKWLQIGWGRGY